MKKLYYRILSNRESGLSLTELLVALVMTGIVLTAATSGFINLLRVNKEVESKTVLSSTVSWASSYIVEEIKEASSITSEAAGSTNCPSAEVDSDECLVLTYPDGSTVYYGYQDITSGSQIWLKPGILKRQAFDDTGNAVLETGQANAWEKEYTVIADGLLGSVNEADPNPVCNQGSVNWTGETTVYGDDNTKGGFRFCLNDSTATNRLVRVFLYGHIVVGNDNNRILVNTVTFARAD